MDEPTPQRAESARGQESGEKSSILGRVKDKQKEYKVQAMIWQTVHFVLGGTSVALAAILANPIELPWGATQRGLAAVVAVMTALSTFWRPDARAKKFNSARHHLRRARTIHEHDNHPLANALNEADEMVLHE